MKAPIRNLLLGLKSIVSGFKFRNVIEGLVKNNEKTILEVPLGRDISGNVAWRM